MKLSVLERCPSYGMSVLRGFTVYAKDNVKIIRGKCKKSRSKDTYYEYLILFEVKIREKTFLMKFGEDLMFAHYPFENTPRENLYTRCLKLTREDPSKLLV